MTKSTQENLQLIEKYQGFFTENRLAKMDRVLSLRTRHITVVLEDIYQPHNAAAVLRSCDSFGIQDIHVIEERNPFKPSSGVTMSCEKWLSLNSYGGELGKSRENCLKNLKNKGYRLVATTPHKDDQEIQDLSIDKPFALIFGTELTGLSEEIINSVDEYVRVPMMGFSESFNISVCAALCLFEVSKRLRSSNVSWQLSEEESLALKCKWLMKDVRNPDQVEKELTKSS